MQGLSSSTKVKNKQNKKTHNQFGFYRTRKRLLGGTIRFTLTLLALSIDRLSIKLNLSQ